MMMQGEVAVEQASFEGPVRGQEHARGLTGRQGADPSPTLRYGYKPAASQPPSLPRQKEPRTTSRLSGMLQARRGFANL
jgi:hypothetical protein